jgi:hypothetical protein
MDDSATPGSPMPDHGIFEKLDNSTVIIYSGQQYDFDLLMSFTIGLPDGLFH